MRIASEIVPITRIDGTPIDPRGYISDISVIAHEGAFLAMLNIPSGQPLKTSIAFMVSADGIKFSAPKIVLRPIPTVPGVTRGMETPDLLPPGPNLPLWSCTIMGYDQLPERLGVNGEHWSGIALAVAPDPAGPWTLIDTVLQATTRRQTPNAATGAIRGGLSEMSRVWVGPNQAALLTTNTYRSKPCIYAAVSTPPWIARSWMMSPNPVIEGEGALWAAQPHLSIQDGKGICVYAEGAPNERIRVARGDQTLTEWERGEVLIEPTPGTPYSYRAFGPCLVGNRLYFSAVDNDENRTPWSIMTCLVDL